MPPPPPRPAGARAADAHARVAPARTPRKQLQQEFNSASASPKCKHSTLSQEEVEAQARSGSLSLQESASLGAEVASQCVRPASFSPDHAARPRPPSRPHRWADVERMLSLCRQLQATQMQQLHRLFASAGAMEAAPAVGGAQRADSASAMGDETLRDWVARSAALREASRSTLLVSAPTRVESGCLTPRAAPQEQARVVEELFQTIRSVGPPAGVLPGATIDGEEGGRVGIGRVWLARDQVRMVRPPPPATEPLLTACLHCAALAHSCTGSFGRRRRLASPSEAR